MFNLFVLLEVLKCSSAHLFVPSLQKCRPVLYGNMTQPVLAPSKAYLAFIRTMGESIQWPSWSDSIHAKISAVLRPLFTATASLDLNKPWPKGLPLCLDQHMPRFFAFEHNNKTWPAMIMSRDDLNNYIFAMQQRDMLHKADRAIEAAIQASAEQEEWLADQGEILRQEIDRIWNELGDRSPSHDSWTEEDETKRNRAAGLKGEYMRNELRRTKSERERAVWRMALLARHRDADVMQQAADRSLKHQLTQEGLMHVDQGVFLERSA